MNKDGHIFAFVELKEYSFLDTKKIVSDQFFIDGLCSRKQDKLVFEFSGVVIEKDYVIVVFPKGYDVPSDFDVLKKHTINLLATLIRYKQENDIDQYENNLLGGTGDNNSIAAAFWILKDYILNGLINIQKESYIFNGQGRINWGRTTKQLNPVVTNGQAVYLDYVTQKRNTDFNNLIYRIHQYAVYQSLNLYGWLFSGIDFDEENVDLIIDKDTAIYYLQKELQQTFVDREIHLYNNLIEFLKGSIDKENRDKVITFLTPHFHTVWEKICDFVFNGTKKHEFVIPRPFWNIDGQIKYTKQVPDTMFISNQTLFILDAKYYRIKEKLPGWGDLVKQFFYAKTINITDTRNILIFPGTNCNGDLIKFLGFAEIENKQVEFGRINGYVVDVHKAMENYSSYNRGYFQQHLIILENNQDDYIVRD
ncbi:LlaJI family restriction endonuclease [Bacillus cereus group sp. LD113LC]|uniref:LlaJI family restriction endonuclease n=1 Tax=Bacillus cereus group TaxID=86661 RepID=UPI0007AB30F4|nr:LlaJI family restriction endonuclease [Bacillus cereus group sp. TH244-1LC]KZD56960.1 hypothetical protein B4085_0603 [Bacillus cereus]KZD58470.1 hypothetical protein B4116_4072 [Bacillus cereus]MDA1542663.1 LlaJI family restriction endonuclease [Bacillus cereus group sp. TH244-1LC]MDA1753137.1 LlaJI family restriction endonuclease [Bacillus cereus group sp. LD113LC]